MDRKFKRCINLQHDTRAVMYSVKFADVCCRTEAYHAGLTAVQSILGLENDTTEKFNVDSKAD